MKSIYFSFDHDLKVTTESSKKYITGKILVKNLEKLNINDNSIKFEIMKEIILKLSIKYPEILFDIICKGCDNISSNELSNTGSIAILPVNSKISSTKFFKKTDQNL